MSNSTNRNDVRQLAEKIELLAIDVQDRLLSNASTEDLLASANELVRNQLTFVFTLGEFVALQQVGTNKTVKGTTVSNPSHNTHKWHNVRDNYGRFTRKV